MVIRRHDRRLVIILNIHRTFVAGRSLREIKRTNHQVIVIDQIKIINRSRQEEDLIINYIINTTKKTMIIVFLPPTKKGRESLNLKQLKREKSITSLSLNFKLLTLQ